MIRLISNRRAGPIGVDLGSRSIKLLQMDADCRHLIEAARWDLSSESAISATPNSDQSSADASTERLSDEDAATLVDGLTRVRQGRSFVGRDAVLCLSAPHLFIQNVRVAKSSPEEFQRNLLQEAAGRLPFAINEAEIRFIEAADVRQGDKVRREVITLAVHQGVLKQKLQILTQAGLRPIAVDVEPAAVHRCYTNQFRRDEDERQRVLFVHVGAGQSFAVIAEGPQVLFIKYLSVGGRQMDEAVSKNLNMPVASASALRRHNGDRRADQQDPAIATSIADATRPIVDQLASELSMCIRYHSVTFRGHSLARMVLSGGEASPALSDALASRIDLACQLGDPLRTFEATLPAGHKGQWDVAAGLALKNRN